MFLFATCVYLRGNLRVRLTTQRKFLRKFNLRPPCDYLPLRLTRALIKRLMDVTRLALTWIGWPNGEKLASTCVQIWSQPKWAQVIASQRKVHARPGQTESQVDPSSQLAATCDSVWPGLNNRLMEVTQLELTWVGWPNGEKLALTCVQIWSRPKWAQVIASQRKCTQAKRSRK